MLQGGCLERGYGVDPAMIASIIRCESSFNPRAESNTGARGLMQIGPEAAQWIAGELNVDYYTFDTMFDPEMNIRFGTWLVKYYSDMFHGDAVSIAAAYLVGEEQVRNWLSNPEISEDGIALALEKLPEGLTKAYVKKIITGYKIYAENYDWNNRKSDDEMQNTKAEPMYLIMAGDSMNDTLEDGEWLYV